MTGAAPLTLPGFRPLPGAATLLLTLLALLASAPAWAGQPRPVERLTAWVPEWDLERALAEWRENAPLFDAVHLFAASFAPGADVPRLSEGLRARLPECRELAASARTELWLTVVNDVVAVGGTVELKSPALVHRLLADAPARARHLRDLTALAGETGVQGLEIDYENVAPADYPALLAFAGELERALAAKGLGMRLVLQPQARYLDPAPPARVPATIMAYNLFGPHSGPGPKATPAFVREIRDMLPAAPDPAVTGLALATGGVLWAEGKRPRGLTEADALELARASGASVRRTFFGRYAHFAVGSGDARQEVWYADAESLALLWDAAYDAGFRRLDVWRLGGNSPELFTMLRAARGRR